MIILSHRGLWNNLEERNQKEAFIRSFDAGFGTETDLRDIKGKIVISHDMPKGDEITFEEVLQLMNGRNLPLALNIKADGQAEAIKELLLKYGQTNYFTFDMSIPDQVVQIKTGLNVYTGLSDILPTPALLEESKGIWLDCFYSDWWKPDIVERLLTEKKKVCIVSADLHKRDVRLQWAVIEMIKGLESDNLMLCTDKPTEAKEYFYGRN